MSEFAARLAETGWSLAEAADKIGADQGLLQKWISGRTKPSPFVYRYFPDRAPGTGEDLRFSFIDLFAGIGGLRRGFEPIGGHCVFTSEWDKYSQKTYRANFPQDNHDVAGDITEIAAGDIPSHDVLLAGFPCQPFSIAGVSKKNALNRPHGFACETQGTLFFDVVRIIDHHRPAAFLLENVRNLTSHDKGRTFQVIKDTLTKDLGYHIDWKIIDAKGWVPQHRERIFIVGFKEPTNFSFEKMNIKNPEKGPRLSQILHPEDGSEADDFQFIDKEGKVHPRYTLTPKLWDYLQAYSAKHKAKGNGFGFGLVGPDDIARTLSARYYKDGSEILIKQPRKRPRRLTPRECARLMGFEAPGKSKFRIEVSDTQAYRQFGNAVVVPVVKAISEHMKPYLAEALSPMRVKNAG